MFNLNNFLMFLNFKNFTKTQYSRFEQIFDNFFSSTIPIANNFIIITIKRFYS